MTIHDPELEKSLEEAIDGHKHELGMLIAGMRLMEKALKQPLDKPTRDLIRQQVDNAKISIEDRLGMLVQDQLELMELRGAPFVDILTLK